MFTAIQDLIDDTFHTQEGEGLKKKRIEFGGKNIMIQRGENLYLTLVVQGRPGKILEMNLVNTVKTIESENKGFEDWDGDRDKLDLNKHFERYF
jgi:hypothetical protein